MQLECGTCGNLFTANLAALVDREANTFYCSEGCLVMRLVAEEECKHDWKYGTALTDEYSPAHCIKCGTMDRNTAGLR